MILALHVDFRSLGWVGVVADNVADEVGVDLVVVRLVVGVVLVDLVVMVGHFFDFDFTVVYQCGVGSRRSP